MNIISLFSGCGGMDLGFEQANFSIIWANDNSPAVWDTYRTNFARTFLEKRSLSKLLNSDIPDQPIGIIGGPPCQSWSNAGKGRGFEDNRGQLFYDFIKVIDSKQPLFFVAENVEGLLARRNREAFMDIQNLLENAGPGYKLSVEVLNASDFGVPQNRKRVFFVGYRSDLNIKFKFPAPRKIKATVADAISDLSETAIPAKKGIGNRSNGDLCQVPNHEYWTGGFSYIFMSRNRVLKWDEPSFTVQASGRQTSIHPSAPSMKKVEKDVMKFAEGFEHLYRRLSIRECARLQTFPDSFIFKYSNMNAGYKMIGNSVPVALANAIAAEIYKDIAPIIYSNKSTIHLIDATSHEAELTSV